MASTNIITLTDENFKSCVLQGDKPVLVDFWAEWCGPCKMIAPILDEVADERVGTAHVGKVNIDNCQALAASYKVRAIPTLLLFKDGEVKDTIVGMKSKQEILSKLDSLANQ